MMSEQAFAALGPVFTSHGWVYLPPDVGRPSARIIAARLS